MATPAQNTSSASPRVGSNAIRRARAVATSFPASVKVPAVSAHGTVDGVAFRTSVSRKSGETMSPARRNVTHSRPAAAKPAPRMRDRRSGGSVTTRVSTTGWAARNASTASASAGPVPMTST